MPTRTKVGKAHILVVTAEPQIEKLLKSILTADGYKAFFAADAKAAVQMQATLCPQVVVLDLDLSELRARDAILETRRFSNVPMIVLSGQHGEADVVAALDLGADDYVERPFRTSELLARIRSVLRRSLKAHGEEAVYHCGDLHVDILDHSVRRDGKPIRLTPTEFEILALLVRNAGRVVSYDRFFEAPSHMRHRRNKQALRATIWSLRQKIEQTPDHPRIVLTEERIGYRLAVDPFRSPS
jgi:two-component system, OmpR family, KDP operon response regulator KdpE